MTDKLSNAIGYPPTLIALALMGLFAALTSACGHHRVEESATETLRFETGSRTIVEIRVDDGNVELTGGSREGVEVRLTTRARASDSSRARALLQSVHAEATQEGERIRIRGRAADYDSVSTDVTVRVPSEGTELELDIRTGDGRIEIEGVSGVIVAETGDGRVRISRVDGRVRLRTGDGSITGSEVMGELDVLSGDGRIRLDGNFTQLRAVTEDGSIRVECAEEAAVASDWSLRTSDGSIDLSLPRGTNAELEASSGDGQVVNHLSQFEGSERRNRIKGRIGAGGPFILITTMDGRVVLRES